MRQIKLVVTIVIALGFLAGSPMLKAWPSGFGASPPLSGRGDCDSAAESAHGAGDRQDRKPEKPRPTPPSEPSPAKPQLTLEHKATTNGIAALTVAWTGLEGDAVLALQIDIVFDDDVLARRETPDEHQFEGLVMVRSATAAGSAGLEIELAQAQQHLGKGRIAVSALVTNRVLVTVLPFQNVTDGGTPEYHVEIRGPDCRPAWEVLCAEDRPITRVVLNAKPRPFRVPKEGYLDVTTGLNEVLARAQLELSRAENDDRVRTPEPRGDKP